MQLYNYISCFFILTTNALFCLGYAYVRIKQNQCNNIKESKYVGVMIWFIKYRGFHFPLYNLANTEALVLLKKCNK